ncbi:MAG: hypothetical protein LBF09_01575 [Odoribacteraceae bacterium]|jgi:hypothetical protein|nr:hypothetical protein [Odoribacteraceae bacterium]
MTGCSSAMTGYSSVMTGYSPTIVVTTCFLVVSPPDRKKVNKHRHIFQSITFAGNNDNNNFNRQTMKTHSNKSNFPPNATNVNPDDRSVNPADSRRDA